jgi:hypothetical protein
MNQMYDLMQAYDQRFSRATTTLWQMAAADRANLATLGDIGARLGMSGEPATGDICADLAAIKVLVLRSIAGEVEDFDVDYTRFRAYAYASWLDARDGGTRVTRALETLSGEAAACITTFPPTSSVFQ